VYNTVHFVWIQKEINVTFSIEKLTEQNMYVTIYVTVSIERHTDIKGSFSASYIWILEETKVTFSIESHTDKKVSFSVSYIWIQEDINVTFSIGRHIDKKVFMYVC